MVLCNYTKGITERINNEALQDENNPFVMVLDGTVGEYLENRDNHFLDMFIVTATGDYLDLHAKMFGLFRRDGEDDDDLRQRILLEASIVQSTSDFLKLDLGLWVYKDDVDKKNVLTSRNPYLKKFHDEDYVFIVTGSDSDYIKSKFILEDILWL